MKKVYVILISACILANAMNQDYQSYSLNQNGGFNGTISGPYQENEYEEVDEMVYQPVMYGKNGNMQEYQQHINVPTNYNQMKQEVGNNNQEPFYDGAQQSSPKFNISPKENVSGTNRQGGQSFSQNTQRPIYSVQTNLPKIDPKSQNQNTKGNGTENQGSDTKKSNWKMNGLVFVIGIIVGASAVFAWRFATKDAEEVEDEVDEEKECQHAIKENDAVINVEDLKKQTAVEEANQP